MYKFTKLWAITPLNTLLVKNLEILLIDLWFYVEFHIIKS